MPVLRMTAEGRTAWEDRLAGPMFALAILFLVLLAAAIHRGRNTETLEPSTAGSWLILGSMALLWPIFLLEATGRLLLASPERRTWKMVSYLLATGLFPPLRMTGWSVVRPNHAWLPWLRWQEVNFDLEKRIEHAFSGPMFFMAFMILPVLVVEYYWSDAIENMPALGVFLNFSVAVIWMAFTTEFILRISVAEGKLAYAVSHWVDLAVVLLPMVSFLPFLRLLRATRLVRLDTLARFGKYYRLYGVAGKGWRGLVVIQLIRHMFSRSPEAQVAWLESQLESKEEEMRELERERDYYRRRIASLKGRSEG